MVAPMGRATSMTGTVVTLARNRHWFTYSFHQCRMSHVLRRPSSAMANIRPVSLRRFTPSPATEATLESGLACTSGCLLISAGRASGGGAVVLGHIERQDGKQAGSFPRTRIAARHHTHSHRVVRPAVADPTAVAILKSGRTV